MTALNPSKLTVVGFFLLLWVLPTSASASNTEVNSGTVGDNAQDYIHIVANNYVIPETNGNTFWTGLSVTNDYITNVSSTAYRCNITTYSNSNTNNISNGYFLPIAQDTSTQLGHNDPGYADCSQAGFYYMTAYNDNTGNYFYSTFYYDGVTTTPTAINTTGTTTTPTVPISKNIEILNPTYGTTTATTTYRYFIKFKTPFSLDFRPTTTRMVEIRDAISQEIEYISTTTIPKNTAENLIFEGYATTTIGSKYIRALYLDINGNPYSEIDEVFFNVATNTYYALTGLVSPKDNTSDLSQINCELFDIGCQFQKAITFLFVPSPTVLDKFKNLWQVIAEKRPFGYVTKTIEQLEELDTTGATAFDLGTIPFMDAIFTPFRTLIDSIMWALFAIYFYKRRLINLDI